MKKIIKTLIPKLLIQIVGFLLFLCTTLFAEKDLAMEIKHSLVSPCCWSGTVYDLDHNPEMEAQIERFIEQGKTKSEILDYYVGLYGERILAVPKAEGFNRMAWGVPIAAGLIGISFLFFYLRTPTPKSSEVISAPSDVQFDDEIEAELRKMN